MRIRLAFVGALAICGLMTATASAAAPEIGRCLKVTPKSLSNYDGAKCAELASEDLGTEAENLKKGNYQWFPGPGANNKFTLAHTGTSIMSLETVNRLRLTCQGGTGSGEYTEPKSVGNVSSTFTGCEPAG
jgi:hypothetical protein